MLISKIELRNLLSYGPDSPAVELKPLNVLIGPNGSGKSNLIEAISLLQAAPRDIAEPIRKGGGMREWIWKGGKNRDSCMKIDICSFTMNIQHVLNFSNRRDFFEITKEFIDRLPHSFDSEKIDFVYRNKDSYCHKINYVALNADGSLQRETKEIKKNEIENSKSIISQRKDPASYPEITCLNDSYNKIKIYREWSFGRNNPTGFYQRADERNDFLSQDCSNLGLILNKISRSSKNENRINEALQALYEGITGFGVLIEAGTVQVFLREGEKEIPATRLSDGTLRYLCLLAILCHPEPPPLVCIEEPELGLHPDVIPEIAKLLVEASERCQLIVTTHSSELIDALSDHPEYVVVCSKENGSTVLERLDKNALKTWLEKYSLGNLWRMGEIGGNRW